jgi:hypothetical protein
VFDDHHVRGRPVTFIELPDVYNVAIQNNGTGFYTLQVAQQLGGVATIGTQVQVGQDYDVYFSLCHIKPVSTSGYTKRLSSYDGNINVRLNEYYVYLKWAKTVLQHKLIMGIVWLCFVAVFAAEHLRKTWLRQTTTNFSYILSAFIAL